MPADAPACSHRPPCPGCPRYGEAGLAPEPWRRLAELAEREGLEPPPVLERSPFGYRHRSRLAVRGRSASPKIGLFQLDSHRIVDVPSCPVHHPLINRVAAAVKRAIKRTGVVPYADAPHRGDLRTLQVVVERSSRTAQLVLVGNAKSPDPLRPLADALIGELRDELHSLWWNGNDQRSNTILGRDWELLFGPEAVRETIGGAEVFFPPGAFGQANLDLADTIVERIHSWVPEGSSAAELYAGCGAIGLGLAGRCTTLALNEVNPDSLHGLELGLARLPAALQSRTRLHPGPAGDAVAMLRDADVVIADPPRRGLDDAVVQALAGQPAGRLIYLSCSVDAFLRDASSLLADGAIRLTRLETYALFPGTEHVETLALFESR